MNGKSRLDLEKQGERNAVSSCPPMRSRSEQVGIEVNQALGYLCVWKWDPR
jgi:hypothetical protein